MKKLIAMMAAVCALGAYAEEWAGKQFSDFEDGEVGKWVTENQDTTLEVKTYGDGEAPQGAGEKYLYVETDTNDAAVKEIGGDQTGLNVYVDTLVKFTPFDKEPTIDEDAKIAVWYLEKDAEGEEGQEGYVPAQTNLMVTAGLLNGAGDATQTSVALIIPDDFDANAWHQLKIASYGNIVKKGDPRLGFTIELDKKPVEVAFDDSFILAGDVELVDEVYADMKTTIFPSYTKNTTIASLAIKGSGSIDNLTIDATEAATEIQVDLSALAGTGYTVTADPEQALPGAKIEITFTADKGYLFANGEAEIVVNGTLNKDGTVTGEGVEPQETAEIVVVADGYDYISLVDAFAAAVLEGELDEFEIDVKRDCQYEDGFALAAGDDFLITGEITVDKFGIKLMTEDSYIEGLDDSVDFIQSGVEGFVAKFEDDVWKLVAAEPTEVLPTAKSEEITAEGLQAAAKFTLINKGEGYDDWNADFIVTFDQDIEEGAVTLKGTYGKYDWQPLPDAAYTKDEGKGVMATLGATINVAELAALDPAEFLCGITNNSVKAEVKVTVQLVITDGEKTETIGEAFEATLPAAAEDNPWEEAEANITDVTPENRAAVEENLAAIQKALGTDKTAADVGAWIKTVYGDNTAVPAATVAAAKNIDISVKYDLPLMTAETPTIEIKQAVDAEEKPIEGFTFQIKDGDTAVSLEAAKEKIQSMVQFTADLKTAFGASDAKDVTVGLSEDKKTATATFTKATAAGFMKVELTK